jgi:hypothetical protein
MSTGVEGSVSDQVLLRDLVAIPDTVHDGDFVLTLSKGVQDRSTITDYVVTDPSRPTSTRPSTSSSPRWRPALPAPPTSTARSAPASRTSGRSRTPFSRATLTPAARKAPPTSSPRTTSGCPAASSCSCPITCPTARTTAGGSRADHSGLRGGPACLLEGDRRR